MTDNRFECPNCGWVSYPPDHVFVVFHPCRPARSRRRLRRVQLPPLEEVDREEIYSNMFHSLEDALGGPALREVDE